MSEQKPNSTLLYFSGEIAAEGLIRRRPEQFKNTGILLTYFSLRTEGRAMRRLRLLIKESNS